MAKIQILNGKKQGSVFDLNDGSEVDIGNRKSAKISIRDPWISYNHAKISAQAGRFFIEDLGSSNGTWINGEKVQRQELMPNSVIYLGKTKVKFLDADAAASVPTTEQPAAPSGDDQTPWWDRVIESNDGDAKTTNIRIRRLESEIQEERRMRKALEKFLDLPAGSKPGDAARAGELEAEVRRLKKQLEATSEGGDGDATAAAIEAALAEERERTEKLRREHMSAIVEMEGKVQQAESKAVDLERRLGEKSEQVKKEVSRAKEKQQAELDELKAALEEARSSAGLSGDEALTAERERATKLEGERDEAREQLEKLEEQVEALTRELEEAKQATPAAGGEGDGDAETLKSQLWAAVEEATKWKSEARKLQDEVEDARADAEEWQEKHVQIVQEIDEISMEQIEIEEELKAQVDELKARLAKHEPVDGDDGAEATEDAPAEAAADDD